MKCVSASSPLPDGSEAIADAIEQVSGRLAADAVDVVWAFVSGYALELWEELERRLRAAFPNAVSVGCTAEGTIGDGRELERQASVAVMAAELPDVEVRAVHVTQDMIDEGGWTDVVPGLDAEPTIMALAEPFSVDIRRVVADLQESHPGQAVLGGMASGGHRPALNRLLCDGTIHEEGLVLLTLTGDVVVDTVVSQGCRPIGQAYVVTKGEANVIWTLRGLPAMDVLQEMASRLPPTDQELLKHGIFVGRAIDEYKSAHERGDFLIHGIVDAEEETGRIAIAGEIRTGGTIQFHVRDAASADEDLREMLQPFGESAYSGALLFSCNGRGTRMWDTPGHDVGVLRETIGPVATVGCFCAGEIGPIGGSNFIHGYTAVIGLLRPRSAGAAADDDA